MGRPSWCSSLLADAWTADQVLGRDRHLRSPGRQALKSEADASTRSRCVKTNRDSCHNPDRVTVAGRRISAAWVPGVHQGEEGCRPPQGHPSGWALAPGGGCAGAVVTIASSRVGNQTCTWCSQESVTRVLSCRFSKRPRSRTAVASGGSPALEQPDEEHCHHTALGDGRLAAVGVRGRHWTSCSPGLQLPGPPSSHHASNLALGHTLH